MICNNVNHNPNISGVTRVNKSFQVTCRAKISVNTVNIPCPIAMIPVVVVVNHWRDPNCVKSKILVKKLKKIYKFTLNVVEVVHYALIVSATIIMKITPSFTSITLSKSIGQQLVDSSTFPFFF